jgi:hypothetical protein
MQPMLYCWPLGDWFAPPPEGADRPVFAAPDRAPLDARPSVDEAAPPLPWPKERSRTLAPVRVVLEPPTAVEVRLRTLVRVDTPPSTATPARRLARCAVGNFIGPIVPSFPLSPPRKPVGVVSPRFDALIRMRLLKEDQRQDVEALQTAVLGLLYRAEDDLA